MAKTDIGRGVAPSRHSLFFGIFPDESTRYAIAAAAQSLRKSARGRWVNPQRYHVTLHFLGGFSPVPSELIECLVTAGARVRVAPFELELDTFGSFRNREVPVWLGCRSIPAGLEALHRALLHELRREGISAGDSRSLVPHVTLLRGTEKFATTPASALRWRVDEFHLIDSRLGQQPEYVSLGRWKLRDAAC